MYYIKQSFRAACLAVILAGVTGTAAAQFSPLPSLPAGLVIGDRTLFRQDRQDVLPGVRPPLSPAYYAYNQAHIQVKIQRQRGSVKVGTTPPIWYDSDSSGYLVYGSTGSVDLDRVAANAETVSIRVHDQSGNVVTISERVHLAFGFVNSIEAGVRMDNTGRLVALPVVRVARDASGNVTVARDGGFGEDLHVEYRLWPATATTLGGSPFRQTVTIPAGAGNMLVPVQAQPGDRLVICAGDGYTPAPAEDSDVIQF